MLSNDPIITPFYVIIGGIKDYEGAVITRNRVGSAHIDYLSDENWYLIQTN